MKCQKCHNQAILHITEVLGEEQFEELHLCEQCANKYLYESQQKAGKAAIAESGREEAGLFNQHECPSCGLKFVEFRNTGRLGCPHDYQEVREQLTPLLENIQGETRHRGIETSVETGVEERLPSEIETTLYRVVQEALTNVVKHAGAAHVSIVVSSRDSSVAVTVAFQ